MKRSLFASNSLLRLPSIPCPKPSRCPYCPADTPRHWIHWGSYQRYGGDPEDPSKRIAIARCRCNIVRRTFSLLPDPLLPYCGVRTACLLQWLYAMFVDGAGVNTLARCVGVARGTMRCFKARFLRVLPVLRLPQMEGALYAPAFLATLADMNSKNVVDLFRIWKEGEPKLSVAGVYSR